MPRPAAGAPARPSSAKAIVAKSDPDETRPDPPPPARANETSKPEPARGINTQSWEVSAALAASGRAEVILSSGVPSQPKPAAISVDDAALAVPSLP